MRENTNIKNEKGNILYTWRPQKMLMGKYF